MQLIVSYIAFIFKGYAKVNMVSIQESDVKANSSNNWPALVLTYLKYSSREIRFNWIFSTEVLLNIAWFKKASYLSLLPTYINAIRRHYRSKKTSNYALVVIFKTDYNNRFKPVLLELHTKFFVAKY